MEEFTPGRLLGLQLVCLVVLAVAFLAARRSTSSVWMSLMGGAFMAVVLLGVLAFIGPLFG